MQSVKSKEPQTFFRRGLESVGVTEEVLSALPCFWFSKGLEPGLSMAPPSTEGKATTGRHGAERVFFQKPRRHESLSTPVRDGEEGFDRQRVLEWGGHFG